MDVGTLFENCDRLVSIASFHDLEAGAFNRIDRVQPNQGFILDDEHDRSLAGARLH